MFLSLSQEISFVVLYIYQKTTTMTTAYIYLTFNGNCEEAFNFYKSVFGGEFPYIGRFKDMPSDGGNVRA